MSTDLGEADGLDDVFVCQCEDLVSTHRIPHLSEKHRGHVVTDNTAVPISQYLCTIYWTLGIKVYFPSFSFCLGVVFCLCLLRQWLNEKKVDPDIGHQGLKKENWTCQSVYSSYKNKQLETGKPPSKITPCWLICWTADRQCCRVRSGRGADDAHWGQTFIFRPQWCDVCRLNLYYVCPGTVQVGPRPPRPVSAETGWAVEADGWMVVLKLTCCRADYPCNLCYHGDWLQIILNHLLPEDLKLAQKWPVNLHTWLHDAQLEIFPLILTFMAQ